MFINQTLFRLRGMRIELLVSNNSNYKGFFYHGNSTSNLKTSMFVKFAYRFSVKGKVKPPKEERLETDIEEMILLSSLDMYNFKKALRALEEYLTQDYFTLVDRLDSGIVPEFNEGFEDFQITLQNSSEKEIIAFRPKFLYNRKNDFYTPVVQIIINRDDVAVNIPVPQFMAIIEYFRLFDLHSSSMGAVSAYTASIGAIRTRNKADAVKSFKSQGVTEGE